MLVQFWIFSSNLLITVLHLTWLQQVHLDVLQVFLGLKLMVLLCFCPNVPKSANVSLKSVTSWKNESSSSLLERPCVLQIFYTSGVEIGNIRPPLLAVSCTVYRLLPGNFCYYPHTTTPLGSSGKKSPRTEYRNLFFGLTMWRNLLWCAGFAPGLASRVKIVKETSV